MQFLSSLQLHHLGVVVPDIEGSRSFYQDVLQYQKRTDVIHDPIQTAFVQFFVHPANNYYLELVAPDGDRSKLRNAGQKGCPLHHLCYTCESPGQTADILQRSGCLLIQEPVPAVAFGGRKIAWLMSPDGLLLELVERGPAGSL